MIHILTEDTKAGYDFLLNIKEKIFVTPVNIYNSAYGNESGGLRQLNSAFKNLIKDGEIRKNDTVFISMDNILNTGDHTEPNVNDRKAEANLCRSTGRRYNINVIISGYTCIESEILTFKYLLEFCNYNKNNLKIKDTNLAYINTYIDNKESFIKHNINDFKKMYNKYKDSDSTIEKWLKNILRHVTQCAGYNGYSISKNSDVIGPCWKFNCNEINKDSKFREVCSRCYIVQNSKVLNMYCVHNRLMYFYRNSEFSKVFNALGIITA